MANDSLGDWLRRHENVNLTVVLPDKPAGDWRDEEGWGWIAKLWFGTLRESREAAVVLAREGWGSTLWGRKVRVHVPNGHEGQRLVEFALARWPNVRKIQLRCD